MKQKDIPRNNSHFPKLKIVVNTAHKCASTFFEKILKWSCNIQKEKFQSGYHIEDIQQETTVFLARNSGGQNLFFEDPIKNLIITRHPISAAISRYYSFGWTHKISTESELNHRKKTRLKSLENFVKGETKNTVKHLNATLGRILKEPNGFTNYTFVPYEFLIKDSNIYFEIIKNLFGDNINFNKNKFNKLFHEDLFYETDDMSLDIELGKFNGHRRTLDPLEFEKKINQSTIESLKKDFPIISNYEYIIKPALKKKNNLECNR